MQTVLLCSGKGGVGRSSISRALLVNAALSGLSAVGIDTDAQQTLTKWAAKRRRVIDDLGDGSFVPVDVRPLHLNEVSGALRSVSGADIVIIDTAPTVEDALTTVVELAKRSDLVLVPTSSNPDDLDSIVPWVRTLIQSKVRAQVVLNRVNRNAKSFAKARTRLLAVAPLVPVEIPTFEDIPAALGKGLTVLDLKRLRGADAYEGVWAHVRREVGL
jgi:chromosome partitioning protein